MIIVITGAPGSGKGTQSKYIVEEYNLLHISMGDIFREKVLQNDSISEEIEKYISVGKLVPDELAMKIFHEKLDEVLEDTNDILLDGYPRTILQAKELTQYLNDKGEKISLVLNICVDDHVIVERTVNRRICSNDDCREIYNLINNPPKNDNVCDLCGALLSHRDDDVEDVIKNRLDIYHKLTEPVIEYYSEKGMLCNIIGNDQIKVTRNMISNEIEKIKKE